MKELFNLSLFVFLMLCSSCYGQMVQKTTDAIVLQNKKEVFIGKPLTELLKQIAPRIKYVYGNPENRWAGETGGTYLRFYFVDRKEAFKQIDAGKKPTTIVINFHLEPNNKRKPLPKEGLNEWTDKQTKEYGDMIVLNVRVIVEN
jgi:hypothetical protein